MRSFSVSFLVVFSVFGVMMVWAYEKVRAHKSVELAAGFPSVTPLPPSAIELYSPPLCFNPSLFLCVGCVRPLWRPLPLHSSPVFIISHFR